MITTARRTTHAQLILLAGALLACADGPSQISRPPAAQQSATKFWDVTASTRWNRRVAGLLALRPPGNGQAATSRILTYLSVAQYRAVLAAEDGKNGSIHPSVPAAVGAASVVVLSKFFPQDAKTLEGQLDADLAGAQWPGAKHQEVETGEAIGRTVGAEVNALAATDNYLVVSPGTPPTGAGYWVSSSQPIVRSLTGVRPFFLTSASQLRPPPPPKFGSEEFLAALKEVRAIADARTPEQLAIAQFWNTSTAPFTAGALNLIADDLIEAHHRTEREAARILAYANAAAFDAQIACFDAKFEYWFIRPSQADPAITLPIGLPNHPSYPSGHSCITSAITSVLAAALPSERSRLEEISELAGMSRVYGGIHYRFDIEAGQAIGRGAAAFDAQIACFDAKFEYWFIRPSQADPAIKLAIALPNHPSYPSGHSCITTAITSVLAAALPSERDRLEEISTLAGMSRVYGGIHYRFDIEAGQAIGRGAAELALSGSLR